MVDSFLSKDQVSTKAGQLHNDFITCVTTVFDLTNINS